MCCVPFYALFRFVLVSFCACVVLCLVLFCACAVLSLCHLVMCCFVFVSKKQAYKYVKRGDYKQQEKNRYEIIWPIVYYS
jgi:hypothetical protein